MVQINWYTLVIKRPKKLITFSFGTCICICSEAAAACAVVRPLAIREGEPPASACRKMHQNQAKAKQSISYLQKKQPPKYQINAHWERKRNETSAMTELISFSALFILSNVPIISTGLVAAYGSASISHQNTIFCLWISFIKPFASFDYQ